MTCYDIICAIKVSVDNTERFQNENVGIWADPVSTKVHFLDGIMAGKSGNG